MSSASTGGTEGSSPASSPASAASAAMSAPKYGTLVPNRIFVGGISASTSESELAQLFSAYGNVKATKIISDRAGVSKGYGFVTFETEEEAKRLQQESECIILRERKLNIAPAIKKQPFNRSFDGGSGSPPAVPTSPYYYTNGMGLPYQNGLTFYNTGAPTPGTPLAPPADPTAIYQAAGVFGPQAASAHQTFAPMMYPCPAPSLYMPQQYQYSPIPYESYYAGAAGAPQYLYTTSSTTTNGSASGAGLSSGGNNGATSPPAAPHGLQSMPSGPHYYTAPGPPTGAPTHHHPMSNGPGAAQLDHLYYGFPAAGPPPSHQHHHQPPPPPPPPQHGPIGLGDQQLLLYTTDASCQQPANNSDGQSAPQEETRSTSSHSEQQSQHHPAQSTANETHVSTSTTPLMSLMPVKYPLSNHRYTNYHPLSLHPTPHHHHHHQGSQICPTETDETNMHCRAIVYHPVYIQNPYNNSGTSLLPTPPTFDGTKLRDTHNTTNKTPFVHPRHQNGYNLFSSVHHNAYIKPNNITTKFSVTPRSNNSYNRKNSTGSQCYVTRSTNNLPYKSTNAFVTTRNDTDTIYNRRHLNPDFLVRRQSYATNAKTNNLNDNHNNDVDEAVNNATDKPASPPPAPYSPMTRPLSILSPPNLQVQFYTGQSRYQSQNLQQPAQPRRYNSSMSSQMGPGRKPTDKFNSPGAQGVLLRNNNKFKVNGMMQNTGKNIEEGLGGAGDAQQTVGRMPLTPPGTPRNLHDSSQVNDACHQMQTLTL